MINENEKDVATRLFLLNALSAFALDLHIFNELVILIENLDYQGANDAADHFRDQGDIGSDVHAAISFILQ
jgi:hypothetical protein